MNNLIIDAANDKIFFTIIADSKSYTSEFSNNRENFDKLGILEYEDAQSDYEVDWADLSRPLFEDSA